MRMLEARSALSRKAGAQVSWSRSGWKWIGPILSVLMIAGALCILWRLLRNVDFGPKDFDPDTAFERFLQYAIDGIAAQPGAPQDRPTKARRPR